MVRWPQVCRGFCKRYCKCPETWAKAGACVADIVLPFRNPGQSYANPEIAQCMHKLKFCSFEGCVRTSKICWMTPSRRSPSVSRTSISWWTLRGTALKMLGSCLQMPVVTTVSKALVENAACSAFSASSDAAKQGSFLHGPPSSCEGTTVAVEGLSKVLGAS